MDMSTSKKTCEVCKQTTQAEGDDIIFFGEWMTRNNITVHYYCLLLSTHLPQDGEDHVGILGFRLRDIRKEAKLAMSRNCIYCAKASASIMCHTCKSYFHLTCGHTCTALSQFSGQFLSYCHKCIPLDDVMKKLKNEHRSTVELRCYICMNYMGNYEPPKWIYAKCCGNGYVHSMCMKVYALKAGYYLNCIWCKDKRFREDVKLLGVFVPDRDAHWERERGAYQDIHRGHQRCDMEKCNCPKGRDYINAYKWSLITCKLCGSFGAHNPSCIPGMEHEKEKILDFKCETCSATERTICSQNLFEEVENEEDLSGINTTLYIHKDVKSFNLDQQLNYLDFSDDSNSSTDTVINKKLLQYKTSTIVPNPPIDTQMLSLQCDESSERPHSVLASSIICLTEPIKCEIISEDEKHCKDIENTAKCTEFVSQCQESRAINCLVKRMLDLFDP